jgi:uncharacterized membrane protein
MKIAHYVYCILSICGKNWVVQAASPPTKPMLINLFSWSNYFIKSWLERRVEFAIKRILAETACHHSCGFCSNQSGFGVCREEIMATTTPLSSTSRALLLVVDASMPRKFFWSWVLLQGWCHCERAYFASVAIPHEARGLLHRYAPRNDNKIT